MEGGLEAKIHEGGKQCIFPRAIFRLVPFVSRFLSAFSCACRVMSRQLRHRGLLAPRQHRGATRLAALHVDHGAFDTSSP